MPIRVACAADEAYLGHCAAMLHSLLTQHADDHVEVVFLAPPDVGEESRARLSRFVEDLGGALTVHVIPDAQVARLPVMDRIPRVMWYRIFLPELMPDADRVLYLDADTLVVDDLRPLFDLPLGDACVAAVTNVFEPQYEHRPAELGIAGADAYFNSGVLLFNLEAMRADASTKRIAAFASGRELLWPDQDALNVALGDRRVALHPRWNCMNSVFLMPEAKAVFGDDVVRDACRRPAIVHFEGPGIAKPWHSESRHPYRRAYRRHRAATPWPLAETGGRTWKHALRKRLGVPV